MFVLIVLEYPLKNTVCAHKKNSSGEIRNWFGCLSMYFKHLIQFMLVESLLCSVPFFYPQHLSTQAACGLDLGEWEGLGGLLRHGVLGSGGEWVDCIPPFLPSKTRLSG